MPSVGWGLTVAVPIISVNRIMALCQHHVVLSFLDKSCWGRSVVDRPQCLPSLR